MPNIAYGYLPSYEEQQVNSLFCANISATHSPWNFQINLPYVKEKSWIGLTFNEI